MKKSINNTFSAVKLYSQPFGKVSIFSNDGQSAGYIDNEMKVSIIINDLSPDQLHELAEFTNYIIMNIEKL